MGQRGVPRWAFAAMATARGSAVCLIALGKGGRGLLKRSHTENAPDGAAMERCCMPGSFAAK